jgi:16S rRNA processing protein RimM
VNEEFVSLARVVRPQGRRGEVIAEPHTNLREQFAATGRMHVVDASGKRKSLELEAHWYHKGRVVLKFRGVDSINQAEELRGCELQVPRTELMALAGGSHYVSELVGCTVFDRDRKVGEVTGVQFGAGEAPLLIVRGGEARELLIPFAQEFLLAADVAGKRIEMALPERLLELDAPLSEQEKQAQRRSRQ